MSDEKNFKVNPDDFERQRLHAMLLEDTDSPDEADELLDVIASLREWRAPEVDSDMTDVLVKKLLLEIPHQPESRSLYNLIRDWWPLLLICAQLRVVQREIWAASALIMILGTLVTLATYTPAPTGLSPIAILAPLVAAAGVAFLYNNESDQMLEIENTTPASARLLLLTRLTLVFGFDLFLGLIGSIVLSLFHADVLLWPLVLSWLAPMAFLSSSSFLLSILVSDALIGSIFGLIVWGLHVWMRAFQDSDSLAYLLSLPGLGSAEYRPILICTAVILVVIALWIVGREERIISGTDR